jgi:hypothetical protein
MRSSSLQVSASRNHLNLSKTNAKTLVIVAKCQLREWKAAWVKGDSIEDLPDQIYAPLGTRGLQPIKLKQCFRCSNQNIEELRVIERKIEAIQGRDQEIVDYKIVCKKCSSTFTIRLRNLYVVENGREERSITLVSILDEEGRDEGWLESF